jgi:hypothetical protein
MQVMAQNNYKEVVTLMEDLYGVNQGLPSNVETHSLQAFQGKE